MNVLHVESIYADITRSAMPNPRTLVYIYVDEKWVEYTGNIISEEKNYQRVYRHDRERGILTGTQVKQVYVQGN